jgi:hypothetical protein
VVVEATGTTEQMATVSLKAAYPAGVNVQIDPASITKELSDDGATRFIFEATISGTMKGRWAVNWTATITSPTASIQEVNTYEDDSDDDVLTATTQVTVINTLREAIMDLRAKILRQ